MTAAAMANWNETMPVVEKRLAEKGGLLAAPELDGLSEGGDGDGVSGAQGGAQGERGRKRNGGNEPMQHEADYENGDHHERDGEGEHRVAIVPQYPVAYVARLVEEQRGDEHDEEQLGVDRHVDGKIREEVDGDPDRHLHERQGNAAQELVENRRDEDGSDVEQGYDKVFHGVDLRPFASTALVRQDTPKVPYLAPSWTRGWEK